MAKPTKKKKTTKARANKYEDKLQVDATFEQLTKAMVTPKQPVKKKD